jgi:hypothetical protein
MGVIGFGTLETARLRGVWLGVLLVMFSAPSATATLRRYQPNAIQKRLHAGGGGAAAHRGASHPHPASLHVRLLEDGARLEARGRGGHRLSG